MNHIKTTLLYLSITFFSCTVATQYSCTNEHPKPVDTEDARISECDSVYIIAGREYAAGAVKKFIFGEQYRAEWLTPVKVPCLDLMNKAGGLTPIKMGGGKQTRSLRMISPDSVQYNLRSVNKNPDAVLPPFVRRTFFGKWIQDMISTAHPYGALIVPKLAEAAQLYHTHPEIVYVPYSDALGEYKEEFGGMLALLEIRPDEDLSEYGRFGHSKNVVGTEKLYEELKEDNRNRLDEKMFIKSRLFDMFINDWDRHEDQWRWAEFEMPDGGELFRPVPRDRDQVFVKFEGALPFVMSRKFGIRNIRNFSHSIDDVKGINLNARKLDRTLLVEEDRETWINMAKELQKALTDQVIENAVAQLPPEMYNISGQEIISKLKSRRAELVQYAEKYYEILAEEVNVPGTDLNEKYFIKTNKDNTVTITVTDIDESQIIYQRKFLPSETKLIKLNGSGGENFYSLSGSAPTITIKIFTGGGSNNIKFDQSTKNIKISEEESGLYVDMVHMEKD